MNFFAKLRLARIKENQVNCTFIHFNIVPARIFWQTGEMLTSGESEKIVSLQQHFLKFAWSSIKHGIRNFIQPEPGQHLKPEKFGEAKTSVNFKENQWQPEHPCVPVQVPQLLLFAAQEIGFDIGQCLDLFTLAQKCRRKLILRLGCVDITWRSGSTYRCS